MTPGEMGKVKIRIHFEEVSDMYEYWKTKNDYFHDCLKSICASHCSSQSRVNAFGCFVEWIPMGAYSRGDVDLLFGAAASQLKLVDVPAHDKARLARESIQTWPDPGGQVLGGFGQAATPSKPHGTPASCNMNALQHQNFVQFPGT
jgi:hypothetical protein